MPKFESAFARGLGWDLDDCRGDAGRKYTKRRIHKIERREAKRELDLLAREDLDDQADIAAEVIECPEFSEGYSTPCQLEPFTTSSKRAPRPPRKGIDFDRLMRSGTSAVY